MFENVLVFDYCSKNRHER